MAEKLEYSIVVRSTRELDPDRIEEWVRANLKPSEEQIQIQELASGEVVFDNI